MKETGLIAEHEVAIALMQLSDKFTTACKKAVITMLLEQVVKETGSEVIDILAEIGAAYHEVNELMN